MNKAEFLDFYNKAVKILGEKFVKDYPQFVFCENYNALYEEYLNQKTMLRLLYEKDNNSGSSLLDRHKVCACMTVAIIKVKLIGYKIETDKDYMLSSASKVNEQLAFMCAWELFKGFIQLRGEQYNSHYQLPETFHNASFLDTITRSLFMANQLNTLSTPLIANIFFLLEKYCTDTQKLSST